MERDREVVFIDSSVLISCGRRDSTRFQALAREARQRDTVFRISPQVYAEVTGDPALDAYTPDESPVDEALQEGWIKITESPSYSDSEVSTVMDQSWSYPLQTVVTTSPNTCQICRTTIFRSNQNDWRRMYSTS